MRWRYVIKSRHVRYREPYNGRHTCVSWNLMLGKNILWCARQHGHSLEVMLTIYGSWIEGSTAEDIAVIKSSMEDGPTAAEIHGTEAPKVPPNVVPGATTVPWGRLSWRR